MTWSRLKQLLFPEDEFVVRYKGTVPVVRVTGELRGVRYEPPRGALVDFDRATLLEVDFTHTHFHTFSASAGSVFERCNFRAMVADGGGMGDDKLQVIYRDCHFEGADLSNLMPGNARFERCIFENLNNWLCHVAEFVDCRFVGRIYDTKFFGQPWDPVSRRFERLQPRRTVNEFTGNHFTRAELIDVDFMYGIDISLQKLPDSAAYIRLDRLPERLVRAQAIIEREWVGKEREEALMMLSYFNDRRQQELFSRRDIDLAPLQIRERVWNLLGQALD